MDNGINVGVDGLRRCAWAGADPLYVEYHDQEWGVPVRGEQALFERICLEAFQSGLAWITILRKRPAFRTAFEGFEPDVIAGYTASEVERLMGDVGIVRNRRKIEATIINARATIALREHGGLDALIWSHVPAEPVARLRMSEVPAVTPESTLLAKALKRNGFAHVGPTTMYAAMQACGLVDDHLVDCHRHGVAR